jgi:site-specific recombinase XerD
MDLFDRFLQERRYLKGVSPETLRYYRWVRRAFLPILPNPTKAGMLGCIQKLLADGVSPISVNTYLRGFKAYCLWLKGEGLLKEDFKVQFLKAEQKVLATFSTGQVKAILAVKPTKLWESRCHVITCTLLDTGLRISECLGLLRSDVDFDNLILKVLGKGGKHRLVPFSFELRKVLFRYGSKHEQRFMFPTGNGTKMTVRNFERDFGKLCRKLKIEGVRCSPHTLRHTFAVNYLRAGGNLFYLSKILGHTSIRTTERYLQSAGIEDLKAVHNGLSLLSR